ncbi:hypothetical protein B1A99_33945 [Cohnella sp. CIP 111063]|uniref:hypothetical protein n=1 Tax=unclassified Cohnella TaxID=2636738 RepID=UPI000B8C2DC7|nr:MULTISPECIES: hypothetical protein [unclassified Cohnella]OXS52466.1 hypothetical protein B1A99_33945 [Cohnella sp. CIP 111063]
MNQTAVAHIEERFISRADYFACRLQPIGRAIARRSLEFGRRVNEPIDAGAFSRPMVLEIIR